MVITSKTNENIKKIYRLKDKKYRKEYKLYLVEGLKMTREAIEKGLPIENIVVSEEIKDEIFYTDKTLVVTKEIIKHLSDEVTPQGVLAVMKMPENLPFAPMGDCILLDRIQDAGNLGTIIRSAVAFNIKEIYLYNCVDLYNTKTIRSSMSGIFSIKAYSGDRIKECLKDIPLLCADMSGERLEDFIPYDKQCIVIGNEGNGVSDEIRSICNKTISIPMEKDMESLNAGVACSIIAYKLYVSKKNN